MRMLEWVPMRPQQLDSGTRVEETGSVRHLEQIANGSREENPDAERDMTDGKLPGPPPSSSRKESISVDYTKKSPGGGLVETWPMDAMNGTAKHAKPNKRRSYDRARQTDTTPTTKPLTFPEGISELRRIIRAQEGKDDHQKPSSESKREKQRSDVNRSDGAASPPSSIDAPDKGTSILSSSVEAEDNTTVFTLDRLTEPLVEDLQQLANIHRQLVNIHQKLASIHGSKKDRERYAKLMEATPAGSPWEQAERMQSFIRQSLFFVLKEPFRLIESLARKVNASNLDDFEPASVFRVCASLYNIRPAEEVHQHLWQGLRRLNVSAQLWSQAPRRGQEHHNSCKQEQQLARNSSMASLDGHLDDQIAGQFCSFVAYTIARWSLPSTVIDRRHTDYMATWKDLCKSRAIGQAFTEYPRGDTLTGELLPRASRTHIHQAVIDLVDKFDDAWATSLVEQLVAVISNRLALYEISKAQKTKGKLFLSKATRPNNILQHLLRTISSFREVQHQFMTYDGNFLSSSILQWIRDLFLKQWDGKPIARRASNVGGAIQILAAMFEDKNNLGLLPSDFHIPLLCDRLDPMEMPVEWLSFRLNNKSLHLLSYSFLFPPDIVVTYFRAINFASMSKSFENAMAMSRHVHGMAFREFISVHNEVELYTLLKPTMSTYLVLPVSRSNVLADAMDQLWRREKRELLRPLKVRMGMDEGEEGVDHGGVQQEFFRIVFAEALDPDFGMFSLDPRDRMTWFQPGSLEVLYKFEMLGILMSLAVYNSVTLPVTFPIAFYRKLLGLKVKKLDHIRDGWPELTRGLEDLLEWSDGDVGDIFLRTYEFTYEFSGHQVSVDMERFNRETPWPPRVTSKGKGKAKSASFDIPLEDKAMSLGEEDEDLANIALNTSNPIDEPAEVSAAEVPEASLVTNENRISYVKDYIFWLTDKSIRPQYEAFARGFYTCLDRTALSIFTPEALKSVVEGIQELDIDALRETAKYEDGFHDDHPFIETFWDIVKAYPTEKQKQLLEFVTASDRVPVNGVKSIMFVIQRNGDNDQRLPTSMTCFGRLLLPQYSSKELLVEKLDKAIENSKGFGAM